MSAAAEKWPGAPALARSIVPPLWLVAALLLQAAADRWFPIATWVTGPIRYVGIALIAGGLALPVWASRGFRRAGTGIEPFTASTSLVVAGPYRFTRNPMYLGMVVGLLGAATLYGTVAPVIVALAFAVLIDRLFVQYEERMLESIHGASYLEFKQHVRRWL